MNTSTRLLSVLYCASLISGCASSLDTPLLFGQSNTVGFSVGAGATHGGAEFTLGFQGQNFALVPVTMNSSDGSTQPVLGQNDSVKDALSVFGQFGFGARTDRAKPTVALGKFFATGSAAKVLADGYAAKMGNQRSGPPAECGGAVLAQSDVNATAVRTKTIAPAVPPQVSPSTPISALKSGSAPALADELKRGATMIFAQYETLGLAFTGAAAQQGGDFTLGYKDRNFALVPVVMRDASGRPELVLSRQTRDDGAPFADSLSVLGQFRVESGERNAATDVGLEKFFTTGLAAKTLSDGFATKLCDEYQAPNRTR